MPLVDSLMQNHFKQLKIRCMTKAASWASDVQWTFAVLACHKDHLVPGVVAVLVSAKTSAACLEHGSRNIEGCTGVQTWSAHIACSMCVSVYISCTPESCKQQVPR